MLDDVSITRAGRRYKKAVYFLLLLHSFAKPLILEDWEVCSKMADVQIKHQLTLDRAKTLPPTRDGATGKESLPEAKKTNVHPKGSSGAENASIYFVGTATTILEWEGIRVMGKMRFHHAQDENC
jgi:hypothetical protein